MPKRFLEDIVPAKRQSIKIRKQPEPAELRETGEEYKSPKNKIENRSRKMLWFVAFVSAIFCFFAISFLFSKAEVSVNPKTKDITLNENFSAGKDSNTGALSFDLIVISGEESKNIQANGEKEVKEAATGTIIIYNAFSSSPQTLAVDTRLEGSNGKIYKTQQKIVVPGTGKNNVPGSIEVGIYGGDVGPEYNSAPLDFKILGFKGTPKYSKFYGRSKGEITGGFVGKAPVILDDEKTSTADSLKTILETKLLQKATGQIPNGFVLFKDATFFNTDDTSISPVSADGSLTMTLKGTLHGLLLNEQKLAESIAKNNIDQYDGSEIYVSNIKDLVFSLSNKDNVLFDSVQNIDFNLSGSAKIVWKIDVDKFIADLLGKSKKDFNQILSQYEGIDSATLSLSPLWKMSIPDQAKDVKVIVNYPQ